MNIDYRYVRPHKTQILKKMHSEKLNKRENLSYEILEDALILPAKKDGKIPFGLGGIVTQEGEYVSNSGIDGRFGGYYECKNSQYRDEKVVFCGYLINHWGHFLIESVARLWYFLKNDTSVDKYVFVVDYDKDAGVNGNYKEFFELLSVYDKLEIISVPTKFREVILPELSYKRGEYYSESYKQIFSIVKERALLQNFILNNSVDKLFLSRRFFAEKTEVGVDMLDDLFSCNNYYILYPERVSLTDMIHLLDCAKVCAAESGTLPHNFLFADDEKEVVIIERQDTPNEVQVDMDKIKDLKVTYVDGYFTIYPVGAGFGPYYLAYNDYMCGFTKEYGMCAPNAQFLSDQYKRQCVAKYMKIYRNNYGYQWALEKWQLPYASLYYESYVDTNRYIGEYLSGKKLFKITQILTVKYLKTTIKCLLRK